MKNILLFFATSFLLSGQPVNPLPQELDVPIQEVAKADAPAKRDLLIDDLVDAVGAHRTAFARFVTGAVGFKRLLLEIENARLGEQSGATPGAGAGTGLVSKGAIPSVLALAVENGALTRSVNNTSTTFTGNLYGLSRLLTLQEQFPYCPTPENRCYTPLTRLAKNVSVSVTYDASRPGSETIAATPAAGSSPTMVPVLTGSARQISNWGVRYVFNDQKDLRSKALQSAWAKKVTDSSLQIAGAEILKSTNAFETLHNDTAYQNWQQATTAKIKQVFDVAGTPAQREQSIRSILAQAYAELTPIVRKALPNIDTEMAKFLMSQNRFFAVREQLIDSLSKNIFTFEYTNPRPANQPDTSVVRAIYAWEPSNSAWSFTANLAAEFYNSAPKVAKVGAFRDLQLSAQYDSTLPEVPNFGKPVFSLAGYYQYQQEASLIQIGAGNLAPGTGIVLPSAASVLLAPKGNIGIAQAKLTLRFKDTGIKMPLAVTWSNRSELILGHEWRANIGLSFDMDSLFLKK
jgi:hypothetical protein